MDKDKETALKQARAALPEHIRRKLNGSFTEDDLCGTVVIGDECGCSESNVNDNNTRIRVRIESGCGDVPEYRITEEELREHNRLLRERLTKSGNLTEQEIDEFFTLLEGEVGG